MILIEEAQRLLDEAYLLNPGPWYQHSKNVAQGAMLITEKTKMHDKNTAYSLGLLHDIGRRYGRTHIKHVYDGYHFLKDKDILASEICLSHTFPNKNIREYQGDFDLSENELHELEQTLNGIEYTFYHRLIILCDGYGFINGFISLEKRWIDAAIRLGINELTINKWKKMYEIRDEINKVYKIDIEEILEL